MLENLIFMLAVFGFCLYALFFGWMLLVAPGRCPAWYSWGQPSVTLVRKRPLELGKRFLGLCLSAMILFVFMPHVMPGIVHPARIVLSRGESLFPAGTARWDELGFGLFGLAAGYYLLARPAKSVERMFWADTSRLKDKITLRLWTTAIRTAALAFTLLALLFVADFIRSLRH
jgi:hypothetical protein